MGDDVTDIEVSDEELTDEDGRLLMLEALADLHELADSEENEVLADILYWILTHDQWLDDEDGPYDGFLLLFVRNLLILGEVEEAVEARTYLDPEVVANHSVMRAEDAIHDIFVAQLMGDAAALQRAARAAVEPVSRSDEPTHHQMLHSALAGVGLATTDARSELRERVGRNLGDHPEAVATERIIAAFTSIGRGEATIELEEDLVSLARQLCEQDHLERAASALMAATQVAVHRRDVQRAAAHAGAGRQLMCSRLSTAQHPERRWLDLTYASMLHALGRTRLAVQVFVSLRGALAGSRDLLAGHTHLMSSITQVESDPWAALAAALLAHDCFVGFRSTLPTVGERSQLDEMVSAGAEIALQAAERTGDPAVLAEVLEIVRMQGLPTGVGASGQAGAAGGPTSGTGAGTPLWMLMDVLGVPATRPRWRVQNEQQPAVLTGPRPRPRMPWGESALSRLAHHDDDGQIVAIQVVR